MALARLMKCSQLGGKEAEGTYGRGERVTGRVGEGASLKLRERRYHGAEGTRC